MKCDHDLRAIRAFVESLWAALGRYEQLLSAHTGCLDVEGRCEEVAVADRLVRLIEKYVAAVEARLPPWANLMHRRAAEAEEGRETNWRWRREEYRALAETIDKMPPAVVLPTTGLDDTGKTG